MLLIGIIAFSVIETGNLIAAEPLIPKAKKRISDLIERLASSNPEPKIEGGEAEFPRKYRPAVQKRVLAAGDALVAEGVAAFPKLVECVGDKRYSYTFIGSAGDKNRAVGSMCRSIIEHQIHVYHDSIELIGLNGIPFGDPDLGSSKWLKNHQDMTLRELQLEAAEKALEWTVAADGKTFIHGPSPAKTAEILARNRQSLIELIEQLRVGEAISRQESFSTVMGRRHHK